MSALSNRELLEYMKKLSAVIGQALNAEGISAQLIRAKQGPLTLTYQVHLLNARHNQIQLAKKLGDAMESYSGLGPVRVVFSLGQLIVEFPSPVICTPHASLLAANSRGANLAIGFDHWGEPVHLDLTRYPNLLVVGRPGSGKTSAMRSILYSALLMSNQQKVAVETIICAQKINFWVPFENARGFSGYLVEKDEIGKYLEELAKDLIDKAKNKDRFYPARILVLDDLMSLLANNKAMEEALYILVSTGRAVGLYVLIGTQSAGIKAGTGGVAVEDSIAARLLYRATSSSSAARGTGEGSEALTDLTVQEGDALFILGSTKIRVATGYVSDEDIREDLPKRDHGLTIEHSELEKVQHRGVDMNKEDLPSLPKIKPARKLTEEETDMLYVYLEFVQNNNLKYSQRSVLLSLFDGKNSTLVGYLKEALGEDFSEYFPTKDTATMTV